ILVSAPRATDIAIDGGNTIGIEPVVLAPRLAPALQVSSVAAFDSSAAADRPLVLSTDVAAHLSYNVAVSSGGAFDVSLPQWLTIDSGNGAVFELRSVDGSAAPDWLHFDPLPGPLQGTPPPGMHGTLQLELIVTDGHGLHVSGAVQLHFDAVAHPS